MKLWRNLIPPKTRSQTNGASIFLFLLSPVVDHILEHTNNTHQQAEATWPKAEALHRGRRHLVHSNDREDLLPPPRELYGVLDEQRSQRPFEEEVRHDLTFDIGEVYDLFNARLKETLKMGGPGGAIDETILEFYGHPSSRRFFGNLARLDTNPEQRFATYSLSAASHTAMKELFCYNLGPHEYRTFTNDRVIITVWHDNKQLMTASTEFTYQSVAKGVHRGIDLTNQTPILSIATIEALLKTATREELQTLAKSCGLATSGTNTELAFRIGGRVPPPPIGIVTPIDETSRLLLLLLLKAPLRPVMRSARPTSTICR